VAGISSLPAGDPPQPGWNTYIAVDSADDVAQRGQNAGGSVIVAPFDAEPAGRMAVLADPCGAQFCVWEAQQRRGAQLVNEPSAWAMSALNTSETGRAEAFYGDLFGWQSEHVDFGDAEITLWRLPGYVGGEPHQPVPRDVVGVMTPRPGGDGRSSWSVDFWVKDADLAAANAAELGGTILLGPLDAPGFRTAVIADPHGAVFSVSQLKVPV